MSDGEALSPPSDDIPVRIENIQMFWNDLDMSADAGNTTWDVLDPLRDRVTMYLMHDPPDVLSAESLTAEAMLRIIGQDYE